MANEYKQELESRLYELFTAKVLGSGHSEVTPYLDDKDVIKAMFHAFVIGYLMGGQSVQD